MFLKKHWLIMVIIPLFAFVVLFMVSKNSPLYLDNDWVDVNIFFTIGRGWAHGMLPYRDLFDQKGPILYAIYALAGGISGQYWSIFILEWLCFTGSLFLVYLIGKRFLTQQLSLGFVFLGGLLLVLSPFFVTGGSAEEWMLPSILYLIDRTLAIDANERQTWRDGFLIGLAVAWVFWIKYTAFGAWLGFWIVLVICKMLTKQWRELWQLFTGAVIGGLALSLPILAYFGFRHGLKALGFSYFVANLKYYPAGVEVGFIGRLLNSLSAYFTRFSSMPILLILSTVGLLAIIIDRKIFRSIPGLLLFLGAYFCLIVLTLSGRSNYPYYWLICMPFVLMSLLPILIRIGTKQTAESTLIVALASLVLIVTFNTNIKDSRIYPYNAAIDVSLRSKVPAQIAFAHRIKQSKNRSFLNYNALDMGVYQALGELPSNRFFFKANLPTDKFPAMMNQQNLIIEQKQVKFVATSVYAYQDEKTAVPALLKNNYRRIMRRVRYSSGAKLTMLLYERKD
ncbi:hypothetical protein OKX02_13250 [Lacticaseibacillus paracasei]|uniref:hypothetical protein n=1 Tax=Lacticaseibacillus paracasei TaxID=1597 RepID=UPI00222FD021|nr:hypothetical protein [Lacticaseibacillus paracasei]UZD25791.1 hypothetical protein OKX02_13250 [Lacticaseibacillus paracasei]